MLEDACLEEVLVVALHAEDGRVDKVERGAVLLEDTLAYALYGGLASVRVAHDASFADVGAASFELRLDENDDGALPRMIGRAESSEDCGKHERRRDERDVHGDEGWRGLAGSEEFAWSEETGVGALAESDAWVVTEFVGDLAVAGVDCEDRLCAALQHAVGKASGRGAYVDAREIGEVDGPVGEGALELEAAATDVFEIGAKEADDGVGGDGGTWFVNALLVDENAAGEDESLCALAGGGVALIDEKLVNAVFW
jgi:hypothetical protein